MVALVRKLTTEVDDELVRARRTALSTGAAYVIQIKAIRGSMGRISMDGWDYMVDRSNVDFQPVFTDVADE